MYIEPKPTSTFGETLGWAIPLSPQPTGTMRRPKILKNKPSTSLAGFEQTAPPSFQNFVQRTPPVDSSKPLPPTPLQPRRSSSLGASEASASPPRGKGRRSSSVYSRTVSGWQPSFTSWKTDDFAEETNLLFGPIAYSASTPQLVEKQPTPPLLQPSVYEPKPRPYQPLIVTPSPTASRATTPSPAPMQPRPSILLPEPVESPQIPRKHLRMVSLEKAKAASQAPGAQHLLPEEQRANILRKSRSYQELHVIRSSNDIFDHYGTATPQPPTLVDIQGRDRIISSPTAMAFSHELRSPVVERLPTQDRYRVSETPAEEQDRGRTMTRGSRGSQGNYNLNFPPETRIKRKSSPAQLAAVEARDFANEYGSLVSQQHRQPSSSPAASSTKSDNSVRQHMKMVPQPLFQRKPVPNLPGENTSRRYDSPTGSSVSPFARREESQDSESRYSNHIQEARVPSLRLSVTPDSGHRRRSTSGSIPISSPFVNQTTFGFHMAQAPLPAYARTLPPGRAAAIEAMKLYPLPPPPPPTVTSKGKHGLRDNDVPRASAYYPFVAKRKGKTAGKGKLASSNEPGPTSPAVPLLAADIVAQRLQTPEVTPDEMPGRGPFPNISNNLPQSVSRPSYESAAETAEKSRVTTCSTAGSGNALRRVAKGAVRYADKLTRPAGYPSTPTDAPKQMTYRRPSSGSPHLLPSPKNSVSNPSGSGRGLSHTLGWSTSSKQTYDSTHFSSSSASKSIRRHPTFSSSTASTSGGGPTYIHTQTPARPLDNSRYGASHQNTNGDEGYEDSSNFSGLRRGCIFSSLMDFRGKEKTAEKRREELKKSIRLVTPVGSEIGVGTRGSMGAGFTSKSDGEVIRRRSGGNGGDGPGEGTTIGYLKRRMSEFGVI